MNVNTSQIRLDNNTEYVDFALTDLSKNMLAGQDNYLRAGRLWNKDDVNKQYAFAHIDISMTYLHNYRLHLTEPRLIAHPHLRRQMQLLTQLLTK